MLTVGDVCLCFWLCQGRTLVETTAGRQHRRSFILPSFFEEDTVDFSDDLDTSFFTRVSRAQIIIIIFRNIYIIQD